MEKPKVTVKGITALNKAELIYICACIQAMMEVDRRGGIEAVTEDGNDMEGQFSAMGENILRKIAAMGIPVNDWGMATVTNEETGESTTIGSLDRNGHDSW